MTATVLEKASFSGHETFAFRYTWLKKAYQQVNLNPKIFELDDAMVLLGVGKNMVRSIKHWGLVAGILEDEILQRVRTTRVSAFGANLFRDDGWDPYLEDPATLWLLHWNIASNSTKATTWYWAFNHLPQPEFTKQELLRWLTNLIEERGWSRISEASLERDVDCFFRTYANSKSSKGAPLEDSFECPLSELNLLREFGRGSYFLQRGEQRSLPDEVVAYALLQFLATQESTAGTVPLEKLAFSPGSPGRVFCLTEDALLSRLERLEKVTRGALSFDDTAGLRQVILHKKVKPEAILHQYYTPKPQAMSPV